MTGSNRDKFQPVSRYRRWKRSTMLENCDRVRTLERNFDWRQINAPGIERTRPLPPQSNAGDRRSRLVDILSTVANEPAHNGNKRNKCRLKDS